MKAPTLALTAFFIFGATLVASSARAQEGCGTGLVPMTRHYDPIEFARAWIREIDPLLATIPDLSPQEAQSLDAELHADDGGQRSLRAFASREYAIKRAKDNARLLRVSLETALGGSDQDRLQAWYHFAAALIERDSETHLARLVGEQIIPSEAMPYEWIVFARAGSFTLKESLRILRASLARHVLLCILGNWGRQ